MAAYETMTMNELTALYGGVPQPLPLIVRSHGMVTAYLPEGPEGKYREIEDQLRRDHGTVEIVIIVAEAPETSQADASKEDA